MAIKSKYTTEEVESLITQLLQVLENNQVKADLGLMALGNAATYLVNHQVPSNQRKQVADGFAKALQASVKVDLH